MGLEPTTSDVTGQHSKLSQPTELRHHFYFQRTSLSGRQDLNLRLPASYAGWETLTPTLPDIVVEKTGIEPAD